MVRFLAGGYGPGLRGLAAGIGLAVGRADGGLEWTGLAAGIPSPSWLAGRGGVVHAALEETGEIASFRLERDGLALLSRHLTAGGAPCHVAVAGGSLVVACYGSGAVGVHPLAADGSAGGLAQVLPGRGSGPLPAQAGPHAHHVLPLPDGRVLTTDLGADQVHLHRRDDRGLARIGSISLPAGTGPRDLLALPGGEIAVLAEWGATVHLLVPEAGTFVVGSATVLPDAVGAQPAGLVCSADGRQLYAGVRGPNLVVHLRHRRGRLRVVGQVPSGGDWPRSLLVAGGLLHVTNQRSGTVASFRLAADGVPHPAGEPAPFPTPTCLLPVPVR
ncbi:MAG: beta-propeller fold lactonase family protein [Propionicimonas sp.]|nr:beta-propeller fold lactonase family protein [Propionicimonas sp.]